MTLEQRVQQQRKEIADLRDMQMRLLGQLSEANLKLAFVMRWFKFQQKASTNLAGPNGQPLTQTTVTTLELIYAQAA